MHIYKAEKTLAAIQAAIEADQGAKFRVLSGQVLPHIGDAYRGEEDGFRGHMGASGLGQECGRSIWYKFRWFVKPHFPARVLRLFNRGHLEEGRFIAMLLMIGVQVYQQDENGKQYRISFAGGHAGGSGDGLGIGIPDLAADQTAVLEFKTHSSKSFAKLQKEGVRGSKYEHYVQMQLYMRKMGYAVALYMAVNKDNDDLYAEIIPLDTATADQFVDRGEKLVFHREPPPRINESPGFYKCRWCDEKDVCHNGAAPAVNCRTCVYSEPLPQNKEWACNKHDMLIDDDTMRTGCQRYEAIKS